jgi:DNA invertase Pin-like site-specific DNA recombinase
MASGNFVAYYRVSTEKQGRSGLGLEAQQAAVRGYLDGGNWNLVGEYIEVESGERDDRPQLEAAMRTARLCNATLIIAKLDRLSRDAHFLLGLSKAGIDVRAADMPEANPMMFGVMALVAQHEREQISQRTKDALAQARARGKTLGGRPESLKNRAVGSRKGIATNQAKADARAADLRPTIEEIRAAGCTSLRQIAKALNERGIVTPRGGMWEAAQVRLLLQRLGQTIIAAALAAVVLLHPTAATAHDWLDDIPAKLGIYGCVRISPPVTAWRCPPAKSGYKAQIQEPLWLHHHPQQKTEED